MLKSMVRKYLQFYAKFFCWEGSYEHPKHMFKLMGKEIDVISGAQTILIWTYGPNIGLSNFKFRFFAGYYCPTGSTISNHTICPANHYCTNGSASPEPCPPGSFSAVEGNIALENCDTCTPGYYCSSYGITGECAEGFYCPAGQSTATPAEYNCTMGHYCPAGSPSPVQCPAGSYQDQTGQVTCKECPVGR